MKKRLFVILLIISGILAGCSSSSNELISSYKNNMQAFFADISNLNDRINSIDTESDSFDKQLTSLLDELDIKFKELANYEVPTEFRGVKELSEDASKNMSDAVKYYHYAFDNTGYDDESENIASSYYQKANKELKYIIRILHGEKYDDIFEVNDNANSEETTAELIENISDEIEPEDYD